MEAVQDGDANAQSGVGVQQGFGIIIILLLGLITHHSLLAA